MKFSRILLAAAAALGLAAPAVAQQIKTVSAYPYTFVNTDCDPQGKTVVLFTNVPSGGSSVVLPVPGAGGLFLSGCVIHAFSVGPYSLSLSGSLVTGPYSLSQYSSLDLYSSGSPTANGSWYPLHGNDVNTSTLGANVFKNLLDNPEMQVMQRGTGIQTCGTTTIPSSAYSADRWGCNANVTSGAGRAVALTTGLPVGLNGAQSIYRTSGALTQPVCLMQEISSADANTVAGQTVDLSFYAKALAGLSADNGNVINAYLFTGTGSDQGLQSFTASPAITPAWTGIATLTLPAAPLTITTSYVRYDAGSVTVPANVTEMAVAICFTPTATGAGVTDGFVVSGVQLEPGSSFAAYEQRTYGLEVIKDYRYFYALAEPAAGTTVSSAGQGASTTTCSVSIPLPVPMRAAPTAAFAGNLPGTATAATTLGTTTWEVVHVVTSTVLATTYLVVNVANTPLQLNLTATVASGLTAGQTCVLAGQQGSAAVGVIQASADF